MQQYSSSVMQSYFGKCPLAALQGDSTNDRLTPRRPPWNGASASACKTIPPRLRAYRSTTQSVVYRATVTNSRRGRGSAPARRCRTMPPGLLDQNKSLQINNAPPTHSSELLCVSAKRHAAKNVWHSCASVSLSAHKSRVHTLLSSVSGGSSSPRQINKSPAAHCS